MTPLQTAERALGRGRENRPDWPLTVTSAEACAVVAELDRLRRIAAAATRVVLEAEVLDDVTWIVPTSSGRPLAVAVGRLS